jgi:hypothetical protein
VWDITYFHNFGCDSAGLKRIWALILLGSFSDMLGVL